MSEAEGLKASAEVAAFLGKPVRTLDQWAWRGIGPKFYKVGNVRRYRMSDVEAWLEAQAKQPA